MNGSLYRNFRNLRYMGILVLLMSGCTTIEIAPVLPCPNRPLLTAMPEDLQLRIPEDALLIMGENQLALKAYAKKLESRASCEQD